MAVTGLVQSAGRRKIDGSLARFLSAAPKVAAGMILAVIVVETVCRIAGVSYPELGKPDAVTGWALRPGAEGMMRLENPAGVYVKINSDGMRDRERPVAKAPGTLRIALLGNSYAEAMNVQLEQSFGAVLERELMRCGLTGVRNVDVMNFGVGGFGTAQDLLLLRHKVWKYQPDIVMLTFLPANDVWYNHPELNHEPLAPYFVYRDGKLVLDDSYRRLVRNSRLKDAQAWLESHLRTLQLLTHARAQFKQWVFTMEQSLRAAASPAAAGDRDIRPTERVFAPPRDKVWTEAWRVTEGLIGAIRDEVQSHGAQFWVVTLSYGIQLNPDPAVPGRLARALGVPDLWYPDLRIRRFATEQGIPVVTLAPAMAEYARSHHVYLHGFPGHLGVGHWNETGNRLAGTLIAEQMCRELQGTPTASRETKASSTQSSAALRSVGRLTGAYASPQVR